MQNLKLAFGALFVGLLCLMSCNDPTLIGGDVLESDQFNIQSTEDIEILASTVYAEPVRTFDSIINYQLTDYLIGQIDDPIFGRYKSSVYVEFDVNGGIKPDFTNEVLDSAIIVFPLNTSNSYGDAYGQTFDLDFSIISQRLEASLNRFSNEGVDVDPVLQTIPVTPSSADVLFISDDNDTTRLDPHLRIPVPDVLAQEIYQEANTDFTDSTTVFDSNNDFQDFFPGFFISPTSSMPNGMFSVQLRSSTFGARMEFHTSRLDTTFVYSFPVGSFTTKFTTFDHDFSGTIVEDFVGQGKSGGDSLLFVQSLEGTDIQLEFAGLADFQDIVVNKAELVFEADSLPGENYDLYPLTPQLMINEVTDDGETELIEDLIILIGRYGSTDGLNIFGGSPDENGVYRMNISGHFQRMVDGEATNILRITPLNGGGDLTSLNRGNRANKAVIKGPGRTTGRMKLVLNYTKI